MSQGTDKRSMTVTGCLYGVIEINGRLGGWTPPPEPDTSEIDQEVRADPMLRYMAETGQDWT